MSEGCEIHDRPDCEVCFMEFAGGIETREARIARLIAWEDTYGNPEDWAKRAQTGHQRAERMTAQRDRYMAFVKDIAEGWVGDVRDRANKVLRGEQ